MPAPGPSTHSPYSHRAFLLKALPLGSTGGTGRQGVQEDTHLAGRAIVRGLMASTQPHRGPAPSPILNGGHTQPAHPQPTF